MDAKAMNAEKSNERAVIIALLAFTLLFRLATLMPIHTGIDERDYWTAAKALAQGTPYPEFTHRTVRVAVIWPVAALQLIFGTGPNVYYLAPVLNALIQVALAYAIGRRLRGRTAGILAALLLILFPYMIRAASQVRPEIFSMTYLLAALYCLLEYLERRERELPPLLFAVLWVFAAYESKITNLFFLPGIAAAILSLKRRFSHALIFCGALFGLYLAETAAYALFTEYPLGQLQVILGSHLADDVPDVTLRGFLDLFKRYARPYLQIYWQLPFAAFAVVSFWYLRKKGEERVKLLIVTAASFFLFVTFAVKSVSPLVPAEDFINRYFCAALGPVFLVLAVAAADALRAVLKRDWVPPVRAVVALLAALTAMTLAALALDGRPEYAKEFGASPLEPREHPLFRNGEYRRTVNEAFVSGVPIVAVDSGGGNNALSACEAYFLDTGRSSDGSRAAPGRRMVTGPDSLALAAWGRPAVLAEPIDVVYAVVRNPFRMRRTTIAELGALTSNRFPGEKGSKDDD